MDICSGKFCFEKIRQGYLIALLLCLCMRYIAIYTLVPPVLDSILFSSLALLGVGIIAFDIWKNNALYNYKKDIYLVLFLVSLSITSVVNVQYGFFQNIKFIIWTAISFFILYSHCKFESFDKMNKKMVLFQNILIIFWMFMVLASLVTHLLRISIVQEVRENTVFRFGIVEGRLFGVFTNPNSASIISLFVMLFSIFQIFFKIRGSMPRSINIISVVLQFIYIVLSESRGTAMVLFVSVVVLLFGFSYFRLPLNKYQKILVSILIAIAGSILVFFAMKGVEKLFCGLHELIKMFVPDKEWKVSRAIRTKRVDFIENNDVSNLRFNIWLSAAEIFKKKWFLGVSPGNVVTYAKEVIPETFIAKRNYMRSHSVWIGIPLYTGICGAILMFGFFLRCFLKTLKYYMNKGLNNVPPILSLYTLIVGLTWIYGLVELEILFVNSACSFIFWSSLGFIRKHVDF